MLEYFGFYASPSSSSAESDAVDPPLEAALARAARLADRHRHTPSAATAGRAWDSSGALDRSKL